MDNASIEPTVCTRREDGGVAIVTLEKPPHNFIDEDDVAALGRAMQELGKTGARVAVLAASGKNFCAGASLATKRTGGSNSFVMYDHIPALLERPFPVVAAVQGAAVGAGLGLAMTADFRVAGESARFEAPFARLGFHHGFGLTVTLPRVIGAQATASMLYTGAKVEAGRARELGLCDAVVADDDLLCEALRFAREIAASAPLAVQAIRRTLTCDLAGQVRDALADERYEQQRLMETEDFAEGIEASRDRRPPIFVGR